MSMTYIQQIITIASVVAGTMLTRFIPFIIFPVGKKMPECIKYLGRALPSAVFGLLVIYCFKDVDLLKGSHGIPELIASAVVAGLHLWKKNMFLSIAGGTVCYMILLNFVF